MNDNDATMEYNVKTSKNLSEWRYEKRELAKELDRKNTGGRGSDVSDENKSRRDFWTNEEDK